MIFSDRAQESLVFLTDQIGQNLTDISNLSKFASQKCRIAVETTPLNNGMELIDAECREIEQLFGQRRDAKRQRETDDESDQESLPEPLLYISRSVTQFFEERGKIVFDCHELAFIPSEKSKMLIMKVFEE